MGFHCFIVLVPGHCLFFLLCISEFLWLCCVVALKSLPVHSFNTLTTEDPCYKDTFTTKDFAVKIEFAIIKNLIGPI